MTYQSMTFPHEVLGLARREALQTAGPAVEQVTVVERQREEWSQELERCLSQLEFSILPDDPLQCGAELGDALSCATQTWFERFYPQGPSVAEKQLLPEAWLGAMCESVIHLRPLTSPLMSGCSLHSLLGAIIGCQISLRTSGWPG